MIRSYELTVLSAPDLTSDQLQKVQNKVSELITTAGGKVSKTDVWGRKHLESHIGNTKYDEANYVLFTFTLDSSKAQEVEHAVLLTEGVIRHLLILGNGQE
ncbi:MAG TPA: 30S ribosomal protein S6 [Candidatus Saccharimonadia bacterium]|nr:30S ribosomal protein S6 [Candidatus Saccharimonadia bacterium]